MTKQLKPPGKFIAKYPKQIIILALISSYIETNTISLLIGKRKIFMKNVQRPKISFSMLITRVRIYQRVNEDNKDRFHIPNWSVS